MNIQKYLDNKIITYDSEKKEYTVWDETFSFTVLKTGYPEVALAGLQAYSDNYLFRRG